MSSPKRRKVRFGGEPTPQQRRHKHQNPRREDYSDDDDDDDEDMIPRRRGNNDENGGGGYDSDDLYDSIASSSGAALPVVSGNASRKDVDTDKDEKKSIEEARKQRSRLRNNSDMNGYDDDEDEYNKRKSVEEGIDKHFSLITNREETSGEIRNAGSNADCPVEPFNMREEREGGLGYFDGDTYVFRKGEAAEEDAWVDGLDDKEPAATGTDSGNKIIFPKNKSQKKKQQSEVKELSKNEMMEKVVELLLSDDETVFMAIRRYGTILRREKQKKGKKKYVRQRKEEEQPKGVEDMNIDEKEEENVTTTAQMKLNLLVELADALLMNGDNEAYDRTRASYFKLLPRRPPVVTPATATSDSATGDKVESDSRYCTHTVGCGIPGIPRGSASANGSKKKASVQWFYRGNSDSMIHGPYSTKQMLEWIEQGFFVGDQAVDVKKVTRRSLGGCAPLLGRINPLSARNKRQEEMVKRLSAMSADSENSKAESKISKTSVSDLMADLMDSDDEDETKKDTTKNDDIMNEEKPSTPTTNNTTAKDTSADLPMQTSTCCQSSIASSSATTSAHAKPGALPGLHPIGTGFPSLSSKMTDAINPLSRIRGGQRTVLGGRGMARAGRGAVVKKEEEWMRSDKVDFKAYL